jgi:signal transduction histidine kinase/ActR/RegA family two-component response regulator
MKHLEEIIPNDIKVKYDSIEKLIKQKRKLIDYYVTFTDRNYAKVESDSLLNQINQYISIAKNGEINDENATKLKKAYNNIIHFLLPPGENNRVDSTYEITLSDSALNELKSSLENVMEEHESNDRIRTSMEMKLLNQDVQIMNKIRALIDNLLSEERNNLMQQNSINAENIRSSLLILGISIGVGILILFLLILRIFRDIRINENYRMKLEQAKLRAEELMENKARFMSNMSHEIRTPLTAILGFSEQLQKNKLSETEKLKYIDIISNSSEYLLNIVNEILIYSKIEAGRTEIEDDTFNLKDLIDEIHLVLHENAKTKELNFSVQTPADLDKWFIGDSQKIKQVLINITGNAIKFTDKGSVVIKSEIESYSNTTTNIKIQVKDTGKGIPRDKLAVIFNEFMQNSMTSTKNTIGTGLGLTISKKFIEMMKGQIDVESIVNKGTTFIVYLPLKNTSFKTSNKKELKTEQKNNLKFNRKLEVLLVDDTEWNQMLGKIVLENMNANVTLANNGTEAIKQASQHNFHIVLMDIQMPDMNGIQATQQIRKNEKDNGAPNKTKIIALTANVLKEEVKTFLESGMDGYLLKPFKEKDMYEKITELFRDN